MQIKQAETELRQFTKECHVSWRRLHDQGGRYLPWLRAATAAGAFGCSAAAPLALSGWSIWRTHPPGSPCQQAAIRAAYSLGSVAQSQRLLLQNL